MLSILSYGSIGGAFAVIALILSIITVILAFIFIVPEKKKAKLNKLGKFLHDTFNFKYLIVEKILQALYILLTAYVIILGFFMLFSVQNTYWGTKWYGGYGILLMILGPISIRLVYELLMLVIILVKNVISINNKLSNKENDPFSSPDFKEFKNDFQQKMQNFTSQLNKQPSEPAKGSDGDSPANT